MSKILKTQTLHYVEEVAGAKSSGVTELSLEQIDLSNTQFEYRLDPDIALLVESIQKDGQQIPVIVRGMEPPFQLICGFRRTRSIKEIGGQKVKAIVLPDITDEKAHRLSVLENEERKSLNDLDRANACQRLAKEGKTQEEIGKIMNRSAMQISRYLSLLSLPPEIIQALKKGKIQTGHALELRGIAGTNIDVNALIDEIEQSSLSVRELQRKIKTMVRKKPVKTKDKPYFKRTKKGFKLVGFNYQPDMPPEEKKESYPGFKRSISFTGSRAKSQGKKGGNKMRITTQDLYCGAYILSKGGILEEIKLTEGRGDRPCVTFIFSGSGVDKLSKEFQSGQANTNVSSFKVAMVHLKDVMFNTLRQSSRK